MGGILRGGKPNLTLMDLAASRVLEESDKTCATGILSKCPPLRGHYLLKPGPKGNRFPWLLSEHEQKAYCITMSSRV